MSALLRRLLLAGLLIVLAACSTAVSGQGSAASTSGTRPPSPTAPTSASATAAPIRDFTTVHYTVPPGFVRSTDYYEVVDLEPSHRAWYFVPKAAYNGQDVLSVIIYTLPSNVVVNSAQQQYARIDYYNSKLHATLPNGTMNETIAGLPGYEENIIQPPSYHYSSWFAFGLHHMLQFSCQVGTTRSAADVIANGCQALLATLKVS